MRTLYKPGDKVKLRKDLIANKDYYMNDLITKEIFITDMKYMLGGIYTISGIHSYGDYTIEENGWNISDEMIECKVEDKEGYKIGDTVVYTTQAGDDSGDLDEIGNNRLTIAIEGFGTNPNYSGLLEGDFYGITPMGGRNLSFKGIINTPKYGDVGTYIVVINTSVRAGSFIKGGIYPIIRNDSNRDKSNRDKYLGLPYIKDEANREVNFIQDYIDNGSLKWFATLTEAKKFSEELTKIKITVESEMERLGLHIGDTVKVSNLPIKEGWVTYQGRFDELMGVKGDIEKIYRGTIESNGKLYLDLAYSSGGKVLAEAVTKIPDKLKEFKLNDYKVKVFATTVQIGCVTLPKEEVLALLESFMTIAEEFDSDGSEDYIFINGVEVNYDIVTALHEYITSF